MVGFRRFAFAIVAATTLALGTIEAQIPGRNVNMVSGGTFPGGDPFLQKQNEPSLAVSTVDPCDLVAGANDYRAVNLEFPNNPAGKQEDKEIGDAWLGWYESTDCGATWYSTLVPGFQQDVSPEGLASPVKGLTTGADPVVRSGAAGTFYYLFIAFNRGSNVGKLALARAIDHNDRESFIDPDKMPDISLRRQRSPIKYINTIEVARGSAGQFIDKPNLAVFPAASGTCSMDGRTVPATNVYVSWTEFIGNSDVSTRTKVYFARSTDCGATWQPATKLTEGYAFNQGSVIAVNPKNPLDIYVIWRQLRSDRTVDAMLYARSIDGGRSFTKGQFVPGLGEGQYKPFDQNTTSTLLGNSTITFRTVGYPTAIFTDEGPGYLYLAVTQPLTPNETPSLGGINSRVMVMRTDGTSWSSLEPAVPFGGNTHQIMPALTYAAGKLQLIWYDLRFDESGLTGQKLIDEKEALKTSPKIRHTLDVLGAQASVPLTQWPPPANFFQPYGVAQPDYSDIETPSGPRVPRGPRISQYEVGDPFPGQPNGLGPRQYQFNFPNLFLYGGGRIPFMGDYIDVAGTPFVLDSAGRWVVNGLANSNNRALGTFHAVWTDNRDAGAPALLSGAIEPNQLGYTAPVPLQGLTLANAPAVCTVDNTRTRDANVYTSHITQDFSLTVPVNNKGTTVQGVVRAFAVQLANGTDTPQTFVLSLADLSASFSRETFIDSYPTCKNAVSAPVQSLTVNVLPKSSIARTVYVNCGGTSSRRVVLTATRSGDGASASVVINPDLSAPAAKNANGQPLGPESHNPDAENPDAENPDAENPDAENPDAENPDAENPDAENPDAENPDAENPDAENPDAENPDAENPDAENANYQDVSIDLTNAGDTTSSYQVAVQNAGASAGYSYLLLANRVYSTPTSIDCYLVRRRVNQQLFSIPNPDLTGAFADENNTSEQNATVLVRPGESIRVILRAVWDSTRTGPFCSTDPLSPNYCFKKLIFRTRAQAPNTGERVPREDALGGPDLTLEGAMSAAPAVVGVGGFVDLSGATIRNAGTAGTSDFAWGTFITDGEGVSTGPGTIGGTGGLAPGGTIPTGPVRMQIPRQIFGGGETVIPLPAGSYYVGLVVDQFNTVAESNENNNVLTIATPIEVAPFSAFVSPPESVVAGEPFTTAVTVTTAAEPFEIVPGAQVALSLEGPITDADAPGPASSELSPPNPTAVTNPDGQAVLQVTVNPAEGSRLYRLIATVTPGAGQPSLKFQSGTFDVSPPATPPPDPFVVTNTNDIGPGSLHQVILNANATAGLDTITFDIPADGTVTIAPVTLLPAISDPVVLDGTSQPGYVNYPLIVLDGLNFSENVNAPGVALLSGASGSTVKGLAITSFGQSAIRLTRTNDVVIKANWIGINPGTGAAQGSGVGIWMFGAENTQIGGALFEDRNIIGGHSVAGIAMQKVFNPERPSRLNLVQGNVIGHAPDEGGAANGTGVIIDESSSDNRIGGTVDRTSPNLIMENTGPGVRVVSGVNNTIQYNQFDANGGLGIDLDPAGITPNDSLDADTGANNLQNWPTVDSAMFLASGPLAISGTLNSEPNKQYVIDFHATPSCSETGNRQGRRWFGATIVQTDGTGNASISASFGGEFGVFVGYGITATATPTQGNNFFPVGSTSEFSNCRTAEAQIP